MAKEGRNKENYLFFGGERKNQAKPPSSIFYPGALVNPESYSIWVQDLVRSNYSVTIVKMPLDLAVMGGDKADKTKEDFPDSDYVVSGHSLSGVMTSRYANKNRSNSYLKGIFLMASYLDKKGTLRESAVPVLSITATEDKILNQKVCEEAK